MMPKNEILYQNTYTTKGSVKHIQVLDLEQMIDELFMTFHENLEKRTVITKGFKNVAKNATNLA